MNYLEAILSVSQDSLKIKRGGKNETDNNINKLLNAANGCIRKHREVLTVSKIIYVCKTADEFIELCNIFKIEIDYNFISGGANYYLRVADGVPLVQGYTPWFPWEERFTDYKIIRYRKGMLEDAIDDIKSPSHYRLEGLDIESKDIVRSVLGKEGYKNWCHGTALKYLFRAGKKEDELKDFKKAKVFLGWIIEEMEE